MGCHCSNNSLQVVNLPNAKLASNTLPVEVMSGLDRVLRTGALVSTAQTARKYALRPGEREEGLAGYQSTALEAEIHSKELSDYSVQTQAAGIPHSSGGNSYL